MRRFGFADIEQVVHSALGEEVLRYMAEQKIEQAEVSYEGHGDDGGIRSVVYSYATKNNPYLECKELEEKITHLAYLILESIVPGFETNSGGLGVVFLTQDDGVWDKESTEVIHYFRDPEKYIQTKEYAIPHHLLDSKDAKKLYAVAKESGCKEISAFYSISDAARIMIDWECIDGSHQVKEPILLFLHRVCRRILWHELENLMESGATHGDGEIKLVLDSDGWNLSLCKIIHNVVINALV